MVTQESAGRLEPAASRFDTRLLIKFSLVSVEAFMSTAAQSPAMASFSDKYFHGFVVAYDREEIQFPVYVIAIGGALLLAAAVMKENIIFLIFAVTLACAAYYNFPLLETGRTRLAASRYGLFVEGVGVLSWQAVERLDLIPVVVRAISYLELEVVLNRPLIRSLIFDGRSMPLHRLMMRHPAWITPRNTIRIPLEIFDRPARDIYESFVRVWRYNCGRIDQ